MIRLVKKLAYLNTNIRDKIKKERQTRLGKLNMDDVLPTKTVQQLQKIRNIGIIAHIDAGKTTTTERMLYYAGALPSPGQIDEGTTTMDYMKQERERGITIRSAAISFNWNKHQINLIDTPGHVDFSGEVTRSLRVLDGAVTILDGVKGVEAQSVKVWQHAGKKGIPRLCYINKMDRIGSSVQRASEMIKGILKVEPIVLQHPLGEAQNFKGIVDLVELRQIHFKGSYGQTIEIKKVDKNHINFSEYSKKRNNIIERIANYDDNIGQLYLDEKPITAALIKQGLHRILNNPELQNKICPIFIGSSFKNKGVQPLLDAIIDFLPSPSQRPPIKCIIDNKNERKPLKSEPLVCYAFKVIFDQQKGPLTYLRVYSGELKKGMQLQNNSRNLIQKVGQLWRVRANQYIQINQVLAGDIVAVSGFRETKAGETLTILSGQKFLLEQLELPSAIFTAPIQLLDKEKQNEFIAALNRTTMEDNSLLFKHQIETGQNLLSGLGELHLEIVRDKLIEDGLKVKLGNLKISYKETIGDIAGQSLKIKNELKNGNAEQIELTMKIVPLRDANDKIQNNVSVVFTFEKCEGFQPNWRQFIKRRQLSKGGKKEQDQVQQNQLLSKMARKSVRNPTPIQPLDRDIKQQQQQEQQVEDKKKQAPKQKDQDPYYHINTLPFETLNELVQICRVTLLSGKYGYPIIGVELQIQFGCYQKNKFSKSIMNRCASQLINEILQKKCILIEPIMEFQLSGDSNMIDFATKDIMKRRGIINTQQSNSLSGTIPASAMRGWVKELRTMGLDVDMKFSRYEEINGIDPLKLIEENR